MQVAKFEKLYDFAGRHVIKDALLYLSEKLHNTLMDACFLFLIQRGLQRPAADGNWLDADA